ncbi:MarC family protein [Sediminimonas sp.]|uniref:MarC family protein n=1 Tax=Sediminimonas sp. TaxID=2823379 RepID=UPI0025DE7C62|nr:MarC family protein [Sediminimonas sp.]
MDSAFLISAFATLFVIIDPIGLTPIFVALTQGMNSAQRRAIALRACLVGAILLCLFAAFGEAVLGFIGISMPAFRIAGGILLFLTALDMLFERRTKRREGQAEDDTDDPSVFPLAIPLIAGPGAIASIILLAGQQPGLAGLAVVIAVMLVVLAILMVMFLAAGLVERALGRVGTNVITRLLGMLLAALSVQFVLDGLRAFGLAA